MIKDRRPYYVKRFAGHLERWYTNHFVAPQMAALGSGHNIMKPWNIRINGGHIRVGDNLHVVTTSDRTVSLSTWAFEAHQGHIDIGNNVLLCPGVRLDCATSISIGDNCMFAAGSYVTDADWHDIYDRTRPVGNTREVNLAENVWIGDGAIVCKGVSIGENSIIGAGSIVTSNIPANVIAAGNPARVIKPLAHDRELITRATLFKDTTALNRDMAALERYLLQPNSTLNWLRTLLAPRRGD